MANLRILEINEIKTVPHVPLSHSFVERLIGTIRREFLDQVLLWNVRDLERKLAEFQVYYNAARSHASLDGRTPLPFVGGHEVAPAVHPLGQHGPTFGGTIAWADLMQPRALSSGSQDRCLPGAVR
jgi:hypothetical protein